MQQRTRSVSQGRRSASVKSSGTGAPLRTASISSQRGKPERSPSLPPSGRRVTAARPTAAAVPAPSTAPASRKPTATIRDQLPCTLRPPQTLAQCAALRGTSIKANTAHIPELVKQIRLHYAGWSSESASGSGSGGVRTKAASHTPAPPLAVLVEGRSVAASPTDDGSKASKPAPECVSEIVLPVQQLEAILFPAVMDLPAECTSRRNTKHATAKYWKALLQKSSSTIPALLAAARGEIVGASAVAAAELLTLVYNILKNAPADKQRKLVRLSDKLGLMNVCGTVLRAFSKTSGDAQKPATAACEAVGLLLALAASYNSKVAVVARISRMLGHLLDAFQTCCTQLATALSAESCDAVARLVAEPDASEDERTPLLAGSEALRDVTLMHSTSALHLAIALFALAKSSANATELGARCTGCAALMVERLAYALHRLAPLVCHAAADATEPTAEDTRGASLGLVRWLGHLALVAFWGLGLLQRLSHHPATLRACVAETSKYHLLSSLQRLLQVAVMDGVLAKNFELVQSVLMSMATVLRGDRADGLRELEAAGGLSRIVDDVLTLASATPVQWLQLYTCLCSVYGLHALPTKLGCDANTMNQRLPTALGHLYAKDSRKKAETPTTRTTAVGSVAAEPAPGSPTTGEGSPHTTPADTPMGQPTRADLPHGLLPIDEHPDWFSPELVGGVVQAATALPCAAATTMPWPFTDVPPPATAERYFGAFAAHGRSADFSPLTPPSETQRVQVLRHHIARLKRLTASAQDSAEKPGDRHVYEVVYEREEERQRTAREGSLETGSVPDAGVPEMAVADDNNNVPSSPRLQFAANFESGNLQRAIKVANDEYDLVLSWDTASNSYTQWFCFSVSNYQPGETYRFNIINMEKNDSTFNEGQRPLMMHVPSGSEAQGSAASTDWTRTGHEILYFKSPYSRHMRDHLIQKDSTAAAPSAKGVSKVTAGDRGGAKAKSAGTARKGKKAGGTAPAARKKATKASAAGGSAAPPKKQQTYYTASFCVTMPTVGGKVYLCNCFPFTYSELRRHVEQLEVEAKANGVSLMVQSLCVTPGGLAVPLLTATSLDQSAGAGESVHEKPVVVLDARVHPGETNGSWVMQGMLDLLLAPSSEAMRVVARHLLDTFVFKIIPMLNVDGVVMGNHRCSIPGFDLNRDYLHPDTELNPVVYSMKRLIQHMTEVEHRKVVLYGDFHGHSKAKNFLLYGCTRRTIDVLRGAKSKKDGKAEPCPITAEAFAPEKLLPSLLSQMCPAFGIEQSNFGVLRSKRGTARISIYKEFGVRMSLGVEGTMMGGRGATYTLQNAMTLKDDGTVAINWSGAATDASQPSEETHYNQDTYRTFGAMFLLALHALTQCEAAVAAASTDDAEPAAMELVEEGGVRRAWAQAQSAGSTREPPKMLMPDDAANFAGGTEPCLPPGAVLVAGPYVLATRAERRDGESTPARGSPLTAGGSPTPSLSSLGALSLEEKAQALHYLLRSEQLALRADEDADDAGDDDGDADDVEDDNSEGGDITGEAEAIVAGTAVVAPGLPATADHWSDGGEKSSSSSDAGDDDNDNGEVDADAEEDDDDDEGDDDDDDLMEDDDPDNSFMGSAAIPADILSL